MTPERLADDVTGPERYGHEYRYFLAFGFIRRADTVLDAACGTGYGASILSPPGSGVIYLGVDVEPVSGHDYPTHQFIKADLQTWEPTDPFDVGVSFETIEHLCDYSHYIDVLKQARRWIVASVPVVQTTHTNPFHLHDFVPGQLAELFEDKDWELFQTVQQPSEVSEISVFKRR